MSGINGKMNITTPDVNTFSAQNVTELLKQFQDYLIQQKNEIIAEFNEQNQYIKTHAIQGEKGEAGANGFAVNFNIGGRATVKETGDYFQTLNYPNGFSHVGDDVTVYIKVTCNIKPAGSETFSSYEGVLVTLVKELQLKYNILSVPLLRAETPTDSAGLYFASITLNYGAIGFSVIDRYGNAIPFTQVFGSKDVYIYG